MRPIPPNSPVLLQLRGRKGGERVLPPAGTPIPSASDGLFGLGGVGDPCILCRRCRLGPSSSRFSFPGGVGEAAAMAAPWNKSLLSRLRFVCASSGADEGYEGGIHGCWRPRHGVGSSGPRLLRRRSLLVNGLPRYVEGIDGEMQQAGCWVRGCEVDGLESLHRRLLSACSSSWSEEHGVCPRPICLHCFFLWRLLPKPLCDGVSLDLGVHAVFFPGWFSCRGWRRTAADGGRTSRRRLFGPLCNFSFLQGLLCKYGWTAVSSVLF